MFQPDLQVPELQAEQDACSAPTPQPTLYLHGRDDGCVGAEWATDVLAHLPAAGSRVEIVDGAGHFLQVEQPDVVNRLILEHLAG
jgi:pimeloyl-ACP methyl ester carboxylesterase